MNKSYNNSEVPELLVKTKDGEFIFKNEEGSYSVRNDTIYGVGKYRPKDLDFDEILETEAAININDTKVIEIEKFNLTSTILLSALAVLTVTTIIIIIANFKPGISDEDIWRSMGNNLQ